MIFRSTIWVFTLKLLSFAASWRALAHALHFRELLKTIELSRLQSADKCLQSKGLNAIAAVAEGLSWLPHPIFGYSHSCSMALQALTSAAVILLVLSCQERDYPHAYYAAL